MNTANNLLNQHIKIHLHNNQSQTIHAHTKYKKLIKKKTNILINPYNSTTTIINTTITKHTHHVIINNNKPTHTIHKHTPQYLFQNIIPYTSYNIKTLKLTKTTNIKQLFILTHNNPHSHNITKTTTKLTNTQNFPTIKTISYNNNNKNFTLQIKLTHTTKTQT